MNIEIISVLLVVFTQLFKQYKLPTKYIPLVCSVLGILLFGLEFGFTLLNGAYGFLLGAATAGGVGVTFETLERIFGKKKK